MNCQAFLGHSLRRWRLRCVSAKQYKRGHVELDMFTKQYKPIVKRLVGAFNMLFGFLLLLVLAIQQVNRAKRLLAAGELSETLRLPYPWLMYICAGGLLLLACAYLTDCVYLLTRKDPDTEALTSGERNGVVTSIRNDVVLPNEKEGKKASEAIESKEDAE